MCWLKSSVPARVQDNCCVSGVRGAGVVEPRNGAIETSIDRFGGDYRNFELKGGEGDEACKAACTADNKCRAWTYARPGYVGKEAHCFLKKEIKPPRRKAGIYLGRGAVTAASSFRGTRATRNLETDAQLPTMHRSPRCRDAASRRTTASGSWQTRTAPPH